MSRATKQRCKDCKFVDQRGTLDKCPYCRSDNWVKVKGKRTVKKKATKKREPSMADIMNVEGFCSTIEDMFRPYEGSRRGD